MDWMFVLKMAGLGAALSVGWMMGERRSVALAALLAVACGAAYALVVW